MFLQRPPITDAPVVSRFGRTRSGDHADPLMSLLDQTFHRFARPLDIVGEHSVKLMLTDITVDQHDRDPILFKLPEQLQCRVVFL